MTRLPPSLDRNDLPEKRSQVLEVGTVDLSIYAISQRECKGSFSRGGGKYV